MNKIYRTRQCAKCPWRKDVNPFDIPDGYDIEKHEALKNTISAEFSPESLKAPLRAMACHESSAERIDFCVGWLFNQLGAGNNIPLRIQALQWDNIDELEIQGEQHLCLEDTLPKNKAKNNDH